MKGSKSMKWVTIEGKLKIKDKGRLDSKMKLENKNKNELDNEYHMQ